MFAVTESLVKFGQVNTDQIAWTQWTTSQAEAQGFFGVGGHVYSKKGLALSLAQAPLYGLALVLPGLGMLQTVSILNAGLTAITGLFIFMFLWRMGFSGAVSVAVGLIFGLATIASVYAKYLFSEPLAGLLLLLAAYMLLAYRQEGGLRHVVIAGLAAGLAVLARANNLFLLPVFGLYLLWVENERIANAKDQPANYFSRLTQPAAFKTALAFGLALAVPGAILLGYNAARSGNPLQTGYDLTLFSPNVFLGLYKLLFSPLRGFFVYSPVLLLSLPGWWQLRRRSTAEAWLFAGLAGVTIGLFSAWSSGEGLSWGSRFLVPVTPFFALCLAPVVEQVWQETGHKHYPLPATRYRLSATGYLLSATGYLLLSLSLFIQFLGVVINPWAFLAKMQADFGGEFFLEHTAALYDFRYSQIWGQIQSFASANSDLIWWQPENFDGLALGVSLALALLAAGLLAVNLRPVKSKTPPSMMTAIWLALLTVGVTGWLLVRYNHTDRQFGSPDDGYTQALDTAAALAPSPIITVAQYHYHVPMNRFKGRVPLIGLAQQPWPLPATALPLLAPAEPAETTWLVTVGFAPAAPDNAAERWLALNTYKISDEWLPNETRLVRFTAAPPLTRRAVAATFGGQIELTGVTLRDSLAPGQPLPVEFQWRAIAPPPADYNLFLQLLNAGGALVAQHNGPPGGGYLPTTGWPVGQTVTSRHALLAPAQLPPGDYRLIAGWVNPATGVRLGTTTGPDFVELGYVTIIQPE